MNEMVLPLRFFRDSDFEDLLPKDGTVVNGDKVYIMCDEMTENRIRHKLWMRGFKLSRVFCSSCFKRGLKVPTLKSEGGYLCSLYRLH